MADLILFVSFLGVGYISGRWLEKRHYRSIFKREAALRHIPVIASRIVPENSFSDQQADTVMLVAGSVVISVDFFKRFLASLRTLIGGRVTSYETLLDRARREAILRMKAQADSLGATKIFNIKLTTSSISKNAKGKIGSIEVLAYGTAFIPVDC